MRNAHSFTGLAAGSLTLAALLTGSLVVSGCGRAGRGWFGWASVPACQSAIRGRALSEFGRKADVSFTGVADEQRLGDGRVRVVGSATVERGKETIKLRYECVTIPRNSRLVSATYQAAN